MKKIKIIISFIPVLLISLYGICLAQVPHEAGGFILGDNISNYGEKIRMDTAIPIRYMEWINEVEIDPPDGFKSGLIWYGTCASPGKIIRIIVKYNDLSKDFYEKLLSLCKKRFGEPDEWRGDSFHVVISWKWNFTDNNGNRIGLIVQHNTKDSSERKGNSIKLSMGNLMDDEAECYAIKNQESEGQPTGTGNKPLEDLNWDKLVPH